MLQILTKADRRENRIIFDEMFRARASIFHDRLGWDVAVRNGMEIDRYDEQYEPIYIVISPNGRPTGSLRLLPTSGETMLRNEFSKFFEDDVDINSPRIWECTRFCVHPRRANEGEEDSAISSDLLIGLCDFALRCEITHIVGLYEESMTRVYRRIG